MDKLLDISGASLPVRLLWFLGLSLAGWVISLFLIAFWEKLILPLVSKTRSSLDDHLSKNIHKPVLRLMILGFVYLAAKLAVTPIKNKYVKVLDDIIYIFLVWLIAGLLNGIIRSLTDWYLQDIASRTDTSLDDTLFPILKKAGAAVVYFIAATIVLSRLNVNVTGFLATAGVASLAIAFGAQETLSNIVAGVSILLDRSLHVGERIELKDGLTGDVLEIGLRSTKILSPDKRLIIVPNKEIAGSRLINWTQPNPHTQLKFKIGVAMDSDLEKVKAVISEVCSRDEIALKKEPVQVFCTDFGPYFIEFTVICVIKNYRDLFEVKDKIFMNLSKRFREERIELPYPRQEVSILQK
ncbi:MAG: mechanosensitive ion channel family protein [Bacillota bacterium]